jgi:hypothetical protein
MDGDRADYVMSVIAHRCPEAADEVVPVRILELALEVIESLEARMDALSEAAGGQDEVEDAEVAPAA